MLTSEGKRRITLDIDPSYVDEIHYFSEGKTFSEKFETALKKGLALYKRDKFLSHLIDISMNKFKS